MGDLEPVTGFTQSWCGCSFSFERIQLCGVKDRDQDVDEIAESVALPLDGGRSLCEGLRSILRGLLGLLVVLAAAENKEAQDPDNCPHGVALLLGLLVSRIIRLTSP